jgi:ankyrin repeat protein
MGRREVSDYDEDEIRQLWDDNSCWNEGDPSWKLKDSKRIRAELAKGADPNEAFALHEAVEERMTQTVYALVKHGADVNLRNGRDMSPLDMVNDSVSSWARLYSNDSEREATKIAKFLIKNGADPKAKDSFGNTALHSADMPSVIDLLIEKGGDPAALNAKGHTPYQHQVERIRKLTNPRDPEGHIAELSPVLKAAHEKHHLQQEIAALSNAWKPGDCKEERASQQEQLHEARRRLM